MMSFKLSGGVEVFGFISPSDPTDDYPVIDPLYGIDGFRNVSDLNEMNSIPFLRRRAGMVVGINGGSTYYKLNPEPWNYTITDWSLFQTGGGGGGGSFTGGSGNCVTELYVEEIFACNTGVTLHSSITPAIDDTINLGSPIKRFRDINTISGTTSYWTATVKVISPEIDLGFDTLGNSRIITADSSVIQGDTLLGGTF